MKDAKELVKEKYGKIAEQSNGDRSSCCGTSCCGDGSDLSTFSDSYDNREGYNPEADLSLSCGIPTDYAGIKMGDHVLDLGSGAGNDCFVARALVGESGKVTGLDLTEQMMVKAHYPKLKALLKLNALFVVVRRRGRQIRCQTGQGQTGIS